MKAPREFKRLAAVARHHRGKPNGVVTRLFDHPTLERKLVKNKRLNNRKVVNQALKRI